MIEKTRKTYVPEVLYRRCSNTLESAAVRAANPSEARQRLSEFLFGVNGNFRLHEKTPEGLVPVKENNE